MKISGIDFDFLTPFVMDDFTEAIIVEAWNDIQLIIGGRPYKLKKHFASPRAAADMALRLLRFHNKVIASATLVDEDAAKGMRICVPATSESDASFTIRKQCSAKPPQRALDKLHTLALIE